MSAAEARHCVNLELATGWALHALEPDDEAAFARHLPTCAECQAEVSATEDMAVSLAEGVEQYEPPARLRAAVLSAAHSPQVPRQNQPVGMVSREMPAPTSLDEQRERRSHRSAGGFRGSRRALLVAAAVAVLAVGGVAGWAGTAAFTQPSTTTVSALNEQNVLAAITDPAVRKVALTDTGSSTPMALVLAGDKDSTVIPVNMPVVASESEYVLWGVPEGADANPVPLGGVTDGSDAQGARGVAVMDPAAPSGFSRFAMSVEPAGSTPTTPTTVVATGQAQA